MNAAYISPNGPPSNVDYGIFPPSPTPRNFLLAQSHRGSEAHSTLKQYCKAFQNNIGQRTNGSENKLDEEILGEDKKLVWEENRIMQQLRDAGRDNEAEEILEGAFVLARMKQSL